MKSHSRPRQVAVTAVLAALVVPLLNVVPRAQTAIGADSGPLRVLANLPTPPDAPKHPERPSSVVGIDAPRRLMFVQYTDDRLRARLLTYDLRPRIPRPIASGDLGTEGDFTLATRYTVAYDSLRRQLAFITPAFDANGTSVPTGTVTLAVYSDTSRKVISRWNLAQSLPGFYPTGITYSAADDRYYAIGEFSAQKNLADGTFTQGSKLVGPGTSVVALEGATGKVAWIRPMPHCQQVLFSKDIGSLVVRSSKRPALMFACVTGASARGATYPGQAGLVRLAIEPKGDQAAALQFPMEFFAISGSYYAGGQASGIAVYDGSTDRFYLQSIAFTTPGAFVFDGGLSSWVGFVSAPENANFYAGVNEGLGHLYMGLRRGAERSAADGILVADVRQTPVPSGEFTSEIVASSLIATDSGSRRLFVRPFDPNDPLLVVEDVTQETHGTDEPDYDAETSDLPDSPEHDVFYSAGATGYAAQVVQVGGAGAPFTFNPSGPHMTAVAPGTRALMTSRVGAVDLRSGGASAGAQSALADVNTTKEYETFDPDGDKKPQPWPYPAAACLDAGGRPVKASWEDTSGHTTAKHTLECDEAKRIVNANVRMGFAGNGGATIQRSAYDVAAKRTTAEGATVTTRTFADGAAFEAAGGYVLTLGRVEATSTSTAHGRPGTTYSLWTREVSGVRVVDPAGKVLFSAPGCTSRVESRGGTTTPADDCVPLAATINKLLPNRLHVRFPLPDVTTTPKGAFAGVEQTRGQYFQQLVTNDQGVVYRGDSVGIRPAPAVITEVFNDTTERSRTVTVLAATQTNAVFQVNRRTETGAGPAATEPPAAPLPTPVDRGTGGTIDAGGPTGSTGSGDRSIALPPTVAGPGAVLPTPTATEQLRQFLFMRRSARDIALLLLLIGLVVGGAATSARRRRLVDVLVTVPGKEAL